MITRHAGARPPSVLQAAQPPEHDRERRETQVRLGLAAAGREEQKVDGLAVRIAGVGEARQVQQQERELERPPRGLLDVRQPLLKCARRRRGWRPGKHRARRRRRRAGAIPRSIRLGRELGAGAAAARPSRVAGRGRSASVGALARDPLPVVGDERRRARRGRRAVGSAPSASIPSSTPSIVDGHRLLHLGARDPAGAQRRAAAVDELPVGRDAVAGRVLRRVGVLQVGDLVVPFVGLRAAQVRPRHEAVLAADLELRLEGVGAVGAIGRRRATVDEEERHRPRAVRDLPVEADRGHRSLEHAAARGRRSPARDARDGPAAAIAKRHGQPPLARDPLPDRRQLAVLALVLLRLEPRRARTRSRPSVTVTVSSSAAAASERAQPERRGEEALLGGRVAPRRALLGEALALGHRAERRRRRRRPALSRPARRRGSESPSGTSSTDAPSPAAAPRPGRDRARRPDEVELERLDQPLADLERGGRARRVGSPYRWRGSSELLHAGGGLLPGRPPAALLRGLGRGAAARLLRGPLAVQRDQPRQHLVADLVGPAVAVRLLLVAPLLLVDLVVEQELAVGRDVVPAVGVAARRGPSRRAARAAARCPGRARTGRGSGCRSSSGPRRSGPSASARNS